MPIIKAEVRPYGFAPQTDWDDEQKRMYPVGSVVHISVVKGRSPKMERFYWGLVDLVARATGYGKYPLSDELLITTKRVDALSFKNGTVHFVPKRISEMKHEEFKEYVDAAIEMICSDYLGKMSRDDLIAEVETMLNITYVEAFAPTSAKNRKQQDGVR